MQHEQLRNAANTMRAAIETNCPPSRERSLAITRLDEALLWLGAALAANEAVGFTKGDDPLPPPPPPPPGD